MRLQAIELNQVGIFAEPIRINGIAPGLNVLAGANELGKSTILRGLATLFTEQHRTTKQAIRNLRPYNGGAPFLGCTFEQGGHAWRLEKRYRSAQTALLERVDGRERHQGADAENRLVDLLGAESALSLNLPLLWVEQGARSFDIPVLSDGARQSLGQLLSAQAENTSGVGAGQAVLSAVEAELNQLVTEKTGKARKNSAYYKLLVEQKELTAALAEARRKAADAEQRLARLTELQQTQAELQDAEAQSALATQIADLEERLRAADEARLQLQRMTERVTFLHNQKKQRETALADFDEGLATLQSIAVALSGADEELNTLAEQQQTITEQTAVVEAELETLSAHHAQLTEGLEQRRRLDDQANQRQRFQFLLRQSARLEAIAKEVAETDRELKGLAWPDDTIVRLRRAASGLDQARARRDAIAPHVRVTYQPERDRGFVVAGREIADGEEIAVSQPIIIEVEGLGRIEVAPNAGDELIRQAQALDELTAEHEACLALIGAANLEEAEVRQDRRKSLLEARQLLLSEQGTIAPDGDAPVVSELERLRALGLEEPASPGSDAIDDDASADQSTSSDQLLAQLRSAQATKAEAAARLGELEKQKRAISERRAEIAAELRVRRTRHDELRTKYVDNAVGESSRSSLVEHVASADEQLNVAVREQLAIKEIALSDDARAQLKQSLSELYNKTKTRQQQLASVLQEMRHIEGMLVRDFEDGAGDQASELADRVEEIGRRVQDSEQHIAALRLLAERLRTETTRRRDAISRPLAERLNRLAAGVWPDAEVPLNSDLTVDGLVRQGQQERTENVSSGTREQVAVMARLAYADLLAEGGEPLPVILDDPLVYSDDDRLQSLFSLMAEAASIHQIIVLTCHERAFEPLVQQFGATRLGIDKGSEAVTA